MTMPLTLSPVYCAASVKITGSPTNTDPAGERLFVIETSLPAVTVVLVDALLFVATGSVGTTLEIEPATVTVEALATEIWPLNDRVLDAPDAIGPDTVHR